MRVRMLAAVFVLASLPLGARAGNYPVTQEPCGGTVTSTVWMQLGNDVLENLLFSDGWLWISDSTTGTVRRFDQNGIEQGSVAIDSPGGLARHSDGYIYAGAGDSMANAVQRNGAAKVVRFTPAGPGAPSDYATGMNMVNGLTFGPDDTLYVSNDLDYGLIAIPRANPAAWSELAHVWGTNGLAIIGSDLYANITFDQRSPIERIPLAAPTTHATAAQLTFGVASVEPAVHTDPNLSAPLVGVKGLDDVTLAGGFLYPVANGMGELLRVDPTNGDACLIASGLTTPSSVRVASGAFADSDSATIDFFVTEFSGAIRHITWKP